MHHNWPVRALLIRDFGCAGLTGIGPLTGGSPTTLFTGQFSPVAVAVGR